MKINRFSISLSGLASQLIAVGGQNPGILKICESYSVTKNKWTVLPCLSVSRVCPGSVLLKSKRAFCFGGAQSLTVFLNSVETIELGREGMWTTLVLDVAKTYQLAAVSFHSEIAVFGGA